MTAGSFPGACLTSSGNLATLAAMHRASLLRNGILCGYFDDDAN